MTLDAATHNRTRGLWHRFQPLETIVVVVRGREECFPGQVGAVCCIIACGDHWGTFPFMQTHGSNDAISLFWTLIKSNLVDNHLN